jgi:hypothetical protein
MLRPLLRKALGRTAKPARATRSVERIGRQDMIDRRDHCMAEIAHFRPETVEASDLFDKARQLLTRHWSVSSWRARADILRTAEWLIGVGKKGAESVPGPGARSARRAARDLEKAAFAAHEA